MQDPAGFAQYMAAQAAFWQKVPQLLAAVQRANAMIDDLNGRQGDALNR